jgi:hypothetical protein
MKRTQIYISEEQDRRIAARAEDAGVSKQVSAVLDLGVLDRSARSLRGRGVRDRAARAENGNREHDGDPHLRSCRAPRG